MYSEVMECFVPYEDLSLFNGDLLQEDAVEQIPAVAPQGFKDEFVLIDAVSVPKVSVQATLAHPQNGSQELGLQELLASTPSPTTDLPDPFGQTSAWFDTKTDLVDMLTGNESPNIQTSQEQAPSFIIQQLVPTSAPSQDIYAATTDNLQSLEAILSSDVPIVQNLQAAPVPENENVAFIPESLHGPTDVAMDVLEELNEVGLEQLLCGAPDFGTVDTAALLDNPILSPVSADDVESLLSSNPASPTDESLLSSLYSSLTDNSSSMVETIEVEFGSVAAGDVCPVREKARSAPYTLSSATATSSATSSPRKMKGDRRERKKEQNRTAALRYREKKRGEQDVVQQELDEVTDKNTALKGQVDSLTKEIKYLKDLMAEVHRAKAKAKKGKPGGAL